MTSPGRFFAGAFALLVVAAVSACGEDVTLGRAIPPVQKPPPALTPTDSGTPDTQVPEEKPCEGKACGDVCTPGGIVIQNDFHCSLDGECIGGAPTNCDGG